MFGKLFGKRHLFLLANCTTVVFNACTEVQSSA